MNFKKWIVFFMTVCLLLGCSDSSSGPRSSGDAESTKVIDMENDWKEIKPGSVYKGKIDILMPVASGENVIEKDGITIDASHMDDGYIMVKSEGYESRMKTRLILNEEMYTYELNIDGEYEVYPLQMGNGTYEIKVYLNTEGTSYRQVFFTELEVSMPDTDRVYVFPNQFVWYTNDENAVKLSYDLCADLTDDNEKIERIYDFVVQYLSYDDDKAATVSKGYIPDIDEILELKKGICFDYSALFASMLRAQDIPVRLVMGYVQPDNLYHAWNQVYIDGKWVWKDSTFGPKSSKKEDSYTQEKQY